MITLNNNNIVLRNIQEQVQKNKEDIARHFEITEAMSNLGIKVVGQVTTPEQLPNPIEYGGDFGDTFAVGNKVAVEQGLTSYQYYVYTRASLTSGEPDNYWLNVGSISIVGPAGPQGEQGPKGNPGLSTRWIVVPGLPSSYSGEIRDHDMFLSTEGTQKGNVWQFTVEDGFQLVGNIMGQQGIQGPQGPKGDKGDPGEPGPKGETGDASGFINIAGILDNTNQLPTPASLGNLTVAYLIGENKELYIQVGESSATAVWNNVGPLNAATLVSSGGVYQNIWNADTKVDEWSGDRGGYLTLRCRAMDGQGINTTKTLLAYNAPKDYAIALYAQGGRLSTNAPTADNNCANKKYVDDNTANKLPIQTGTTNYNQVYVKTGVGSQTMFNISNDPIGNTMCFRSSTGTLRIAEPVNASDCATKNYVDTHGGGKYYKHEYVYGINNYAEFLRVYFISSSSTQIALNTNNRTIFQGNMARTDNPGNNEFGIITDVYNQKISMLMTNGQYREFDVSGTASSSITEL